MDQNEIYRKIHLVKLRNMEMYCRSIEYLSGKIIVAVNPAMESLNKARYYVQSSNRETSRYPGYSLIYHNIGFSEGML